MVILMNIIVVKGDDTYNIFDNGSEFMNGFETGLLVRTKNDQNFIAKCE